MKTYQDLNASERSLFEEIEDIFLRREIKRSDFVKVLGVLINKYKLKGGK